MVFSVVTWNINSVRLRLPLIEYFVEKYQPDILCLQETKCVNAEFPEKAFLKLGYQYIAKHGQKSYNGVAILSRLPMDHIISRDMCDMGDTRHIQATIYHNDSSFVLHNFYVPAGGDEPNLELNPKFAHKLAFLKEMEAWFCLDSADQAALLVGDLNIAPLEKDVWSHKQLLNVVSHTPVEIEALETVRRAGDWVDLMREFIPPEDMLFTWWSYRSKQWDVSNRGRRLDHIWARSFLAENATRMTVLKEARGWIKPSDHVPVIIEFYGLQDEKRGS